MSSRVAPQFIGVLASGSTGKNGSLSQGNPEDVIAFDLGSSAKVLLSGSRYVLFQPDGRNVGVIVTVGRDFDGDGQFDLNEEIGEASLPATDSNVQVLSGDLQPGRYFIEYDATLGNSYQVAYFSDITVTLTSNPSPQPPRPRPPVADGFQLETDAAWARHLWRKSGRDGIVSYWLDIKGSDSPESRKINRKQARFVSSLFDDVDRITGLSFIRVASPNAAEIRLYAVDNDSQDSAVSASREKSGFDIRYIAAKGLPIALKSSLAFGVGAVLGLEPVGSKSINNSDTVMPVRSGSRYFGFSNADSTALADLWGPYLA